MHRSKIEFHRCFISSIDPRKKFVEYSEYLLDMEGELGKYMLSLFASNYDNTSAKKSSYGEDSFLAQIVPQEPEQFDAFVDVIADQIHSLIGEAMDLPAGSGLFIWALVEEQPVVAFFKLNFQSRYGCVVQEDGTVAWKKTYKLLPALTQKEYDYFFIHIYEQKVWMSDTRCYVGGQSINYLADSILKLDTDLKQSEKEAVNVIESIVMDTIKECYPEEVPQKVFEYRQSIAEEAQEYGMVSPVTMEKKVFADSDRAVERYREKLDNHDIQPASPVEVSKKTQRQLKKKQRIVTENGFEILVPIEYLENPEFFQFQQEVTGSVTIRIQDVNGYLK